jgi:hypothetical protein
MKFLANLLWAYNKFAEHGIGHFNYSSALNTQIEK